MQGTIDLDSGKSKKIMESALRFHLVEAGTQNAPRFLSARRIYLIKDGD